MSTAGMAAGTWAEWIIGVATFAAVAVAVWALTDERRRHRREREEREAEEEREKVATVIAYAAPDYVPVVDATRPDRPNRVVSGWSLVVRNGSSDPLVYWRAEVRDAESDKLLAVKGWREEGMIPPMGPGEAERIDLGVDLGDRAATKTVLVFQDGAGNHWRRGPGPVEKPAEAPDYDS